MRITVRIRPAAKEERVERRDDGSFSVWVKAKPVEGRANEAAITALAEHFGVARSRVSLIKGATSRIKVFEIRA